MAEQGGVAELRHQGSRELAESIRQNHQASLRSDPFDEFFGAGQWIEGADDFLDVGQLEALLVENVQAVAHQRIIAGLITRGALEGVDSSFLREGDPDFRDEHSL